MRLRLIHTAWSGAFRRGWLLGLVLALTACGFHLQGVTKLPREMTVTQIEAQDPYGYFVRRLSILLEQNGAHVVDAQSGAAVLEIPVNRYRKEILTIGSNARVREYRVRHTVSFRLLDGAGKVLVPRRTVEQSRVISFDEQDILASTREEEFLREELADTLSRQVLRELGKAGG